MEIRFYHLTRSALDDALPELLEKTRQRGWRAVVLTSSPQRSEALTDMLWTRRRDSFLPHGTRQDGFAGEQPIWITEQAENPNKASVAFVVDGAPVSQEWLGQDGVFAEMKLVCLVFDDRDGVAVENARQLWRNLKDAGVSMSYWQQNERGWAQTATAGMGD